LTNLEDAFHRGCGSEAPECPGAQRDARTSFNPLFIGAVVPSDASPATSTTGPKFQSPFHRGCGSEFQSAHARWPQGLRVSIPFSSGLWFRVEHCPQGQPGCFIVSIPFSSGLWFRGSGFHGCGSRGQGRFNPLFIGAVVPR